jgi:bifunctional non-homologous end joining protein LigD
LELGDSVKVLPTAYTKEEKKALFEKLKKENAEGIVFKKKDAPYTVGRPASGGNALKFKFKKSGTFIVASHTKGKRSVGLEAVDGGKRVSVGKVTIPPNHQVPDVNSFLEVQYLYAYKDGSLFQPVYLGQRDDCDLTDCSVSQIVFKAE